MFNWNWILSTQLNLNIFFPSQLNPYLRSAMDALSLFHIFHLLVITEVDVTTVMLKQGWTLKNIETLTAKMTSTVMDKLPGPVVILKEPEKRGKVVRGKVLRNRKEERSKYGDLLDEYSEGSSKKRVKKVKRV